MHDSNLVLNLTLLPPIPFFRTVRCTGNPLTSTSSLSISTTATNNTTTLRTLHTTPHAHILVQDEGPDHPNPAAVAGKRLIEFTRNAMQRM